MDVRKLPPILVTRKLARKQNSMVWRRTRNIAVQVEHGDERTALHLSPRVHVGNVADHNVARNFLDLEPVRLELSQVGTTIYQCTGH